MRVHVVVVRDGVLAGRLGHRSVVDDPAVVHDDGPVHQRRQRAQFVRDQQDRAAAVDEPVERGGERLLAGRVDAGGRLVEDQQVGLAGQGPGDEDPLLLAAGERVDLVAAPGRRARRRPARRRPRRGRPARAGRPKPRRASRPDATTSRTVAGTPLPAPSRCGTYPIRCHCRNRRSGVPNSVDPAASQRTRPRAARTSVDLPEPLAPRIATVSPARDGQVDAVQHRAAAVRDRPVRYREDSSLIVQPSAVRSLPRLWRITER